MNGEGSLEVLQSRNSSFLNHSPRGTIFQAIHSLQLNQLLLTCDCAMTLALALRGPRGWRLLWTNCKK